MELHANRHNKSHIPIKTVDYGLLAKDDKNATLMETFLITLEDIDERLVVSNGTNNITGSEDLTLQSKVVEK